MLPEAVGFLQDCDIIARVPIPWLLAHDESSGLSATAISLPLYVYVGLKFDEPTFAVECAFSGWSSDVESNDVLGNQTADLCRDAGHRDWLESLLFKGLASEVISSDTLRLLNLSKLKMWADVPFRIPGLPFGEPVAACLSLLISVMENQLDPDTFEQTKTGWGRLLAKASAEGIEVQACGSCSSRAVAGESLDVLATVFRRAHLLIGLVPDGTGVLCSLIHVPMQRGFSEDSSALLRYSLSQEQLEAFRQAREDLRPDIYGQISHHITAIGPTDDSIIGSSDLLILAWNGQDVNFFGRVLTPYVYPRCENFEITFPKSYQKPQFKFVQGLDRFEPMRIRQRYGFFEFIGPYNHLAKVKSEIQRSRTGFILHWSGKDGWDCKGPQLFTKRTFISSQN